MWCAVVLLCCCAVFGVLSCSVFCFACLLFWFCLGLVLASVPFCSVLGLFWCSGSGFFAVWLVSDLALVLVLFLFLACFLFGLVFCSAFWFCAVLVLFGCGMTWCFSCLLVFLVSCCLVLGFLPCFCSGLGFALALVLPGSLLSFGDGVTWGFSSSGSGSVLAVLLVLALLSVLVLWSSGPLVFVLSSFFLELFDPLAFRFGGLLVFLFFCFILFLSGVF